MVWFKFLLFEQTYRSEELPRSAPVKILGHSPNRFRHREREGRPMVKIAPKTPSESVVIMTQLVLPQHTNPAGTTFGGTVMSWMDIAAGIAAQRHCRKEVVTASVDTLHFLSPIHLGWVVTLKAAVNYAHRSSCEVGVRVEAENTVTGEIFHTASAYFTMVALGSDFRPCSIPPLKPETEVEMKRFQEAEARWASRQKSRREAKDEL